MPAKSKRQYRFMQAVCHGTARNKPEGLSKAEACEYVEGQSPKGLPESKTRTADGRRRKGKRRRTSGERRVRV